MHFNRASLIKPTDHVNANIRVAGGKIEGSSLAKVFTELVLPYVKADQLSPDFVDFVSLQWGNYLLHHHRLLLHIVPLLRQFLGNKYSINIHKA